MEKEIEEIYEEHADLVYRYIFLLVHNKEVAEDLTQETFIKVFQNFHQFRELSKLNTWIITIAKNTTYDYFRKKKWSTLFTTEIDWTNSISSPSAEDQILKKGELDILYRSLKKLKRDHQQVIILRKINEFSIKETAIVLGWSENKVKAKLARALKKLNMEMTKLKEEYYGETRQV